MRGVRDSNPTAQQYSTTVGNLLMESHRDTVVEIGVFRGVLAERILKKFTDIKAYYGVDPYVAYYGDGSCSEMDRRNKDWPTIYKETKKKLKRFPNFTMFRMTSKKASNFFQDRSVDFVFVDGNHEYEFVVQDIWIWTPKIKIGGILAGHDFGYFGVTKAVNESLGTNYQHIGNVWWTKVTEDMDLKVRTL